MKRIIFVTLAIMLCFVMNAKKKEVDLILFCGQSNMAGRGEAEKAPQVKKGAGYEFRAFSDPTRLYEITGLFGSTEEGPYVNDHNKKSGGMVPAFVNAYHELTGRTAMCVSASVGGTQLKFWTENKDVYEEYLDRFRKAERYLKDNGYKIRNRYCVFCQGESDADNGTSTEHYKEMLDNFCRVKMSQELGVDQTFIVTIGTYNGNNDDIQKRYTAIRNTQLRYCEESEYATLASSDFCSFRMYMKDKYHYHQEAYNIVGQFAGMRVALTTIANR